ncbi:MAG: hypothetical protein QG574_5251 [Cyanobacteriota bacterium erpe_2018_sw_21hr_WHONDRS-SW48-000092_B_bin.40]|jgi:hypothetical protein|nr:hypothetical protein [Cyanobacteriota bacterium erpe_2018_sw_21hr_WHONDRS-SW48-000092_B_bin.40]
MHLDNIDEFVKALTLPASDVAQMAYLRVGLTEGHLGHIGTLYCPHCSEYSGMKLNTLHFEHTIGQQLYREITREDTIGYRPRPELPEYLPPSLFRLDCVNCKNAFYVLLLCGDKSPTLVFFSIRGGGVATPNTPELVKYYLEQAYKAQSATAYSAALAMYRAALEQLLENKGFDGKLPAKLQKLTDDIKNGSAPSWAKRLDIAALQVIKDICNAHVHPSELAKLQALDAVFMSDVQKTFSSLLSIAYEQEPRQTAAKAKLKAALNKGKKKLPKSP